MIEITFNAEAAANGLSIEPQPPLESGAPVITVIRGEVLPGAWEDDCFVYPANQLELAKEATELLLKHFPDIELQTESLRVFTCPQALADKYDWDWEKSREHQ